MKNAVVQGIVIVVLFFSTLLVLNQIDWMTVFNVKEATEKTEEKLGELFWEISKKTEREINNQTVTNSIDSIVTRICKANEIERNNIKIHILYKTETNAFALPSGHLIIYSGLILAADNHAELSGVIAHEIAHIELHHVMEKLIKEIGLSVLVSMTTGNSGGEILMETVKMLSSSAFDRSLETAADIQAVEYLIKANIDPEPFANFLYKLADEESESMKYLSWISTHPDSKERAEYIIEYCRDKNIKSHPVITQETWDNLKESLQE